MSEFPSFYIAFSKSIWQSHADLVEQWSRDNSNPELKEACLKLKEAAEQTEAGK